MKRRTARSRTMPKAVEPEHDSPLDPTLVDLSPSEREDYAKFYRFAVPRLTAYLIAAEGASKAEASECAHDTLEELLHRWRDVEKHLGWCRTAARRMFLNRRYSATDSYDEFPATGSPLYDDDPGGRDQREQILPFLSQLPTQQRRIITLIMEGYDFEEVGEELDLSPVTVRSNFRHAKNQLAALYRQRETSGEGDR